MLHLQNHPHNYTVVVENCLDMLAEDQEKFEKENRFAQVCTAAVTENLILN